MAASQSLPRSEICWLFGSTTVFCLISHREKCSGGCPSLSRLYLGHSSCFLCFSSPSLPVGSSNMDATKKLLQPSHISRGRIRPDEAVVLTLGKIRADVVGRHNLSLLAQIHQMGESKIIALRCIIPSIAILFQQLSGTTAINSYTPQIFSSLGFSTTSMALFATGIYGVVKFIVACITFVFVIESWGRKRTLIYGGLAQGLMMLWIGGYAGVHPNQGVVPETYVSVVAVYLYGVSFCLGWGFTPHVLGSEVAPGHLRPVVMSLSAGTSWLFTYVIAQVMPIMLERITYGTYLVFGVASFIMAAWVYFFIPETTGYPLEDIKYLFQKDIIVRSLEDAPGGWIFLGTRRASTVHELKVVNALSKDNSKEVWKDFKSHSDEKSVHVRSLRGSQKRDDHII
ncbi:hypothetical protein DFH29DRAFT_576716 [Suillus ampliporus]|nr:hypothetical protein DFH29DRAFT_576716 [Suillus ampliporus]